MRVFGGAVAVRPASRISKWTVGSDDKDAQYPKAAVVFCWRINEPCIFFSRPATAAFFFRLRSGVTTV